ncbi:MAG TPA: hypothetical protein VE422_23765 [Terriglobia bacterium]|nr:hypothetical protein [Terriglobia bacterium]
MTKRLSILSLVLIFLIAAPSHATTVERLNLEDLVKKASKIVVGRISDSRTFWSDNGKLILTSYTIEVQETIKGQASRTVELTTVGGRMGDLILHVSGVPSFAQGEDAVVFIENSGSYSTVVGMGQGKFTVTNGEVSNNVNGLAFPDGHPGKSLKMPLNNFKSEIKRLVGL